MSDCLFPDNTVICNFSTVNELAVLRAFLGNRGRVTEAVDREIRLSVRVVPHLHTLDRREWFGDAISIDDEADIRRVEVTRIGSFGGSRSIPTQHLGESQTLFLISNRTEYASSTWITDDREAYLLAKKRGIRTLCTVDILKALVGFSEMTEATAFDICQRMDQGGRHLLQMPRTAKDLR